MASTANWLLALSVFKPDPLPATGLAAPSVPSGLHEVREAVPKALTELCPAPPGPSALYPSRELYPDSIGPRVDARISQLKTQLPTDGSPSMAALESLVRSTAFKQLSEASQEAVLETFGKAKLKPNVERALFKYGFRTAEALAVFDRLAPALKQEIADFLGNRLFLAHDDLASRAFRLVGHPAFGRISAQEQAQAWKKLVSEEESLERPQVILNEFLLKSELPGVRLPVTPEAMLRRFCQAPETLNLYDLDLRPFLALHPAQLSRAREVTVDSISRPFTVSLGFPLWAGRTVEHTVRLDGWPVKVLVPDKPRPSHAEPAETLEGITEALAHLPVELRPHVETVFLTPRSAPKEQLMAVTFDDRIRVYADSPADETAYALLHEVAHKVSFRAYGKTRGTPAWTKWQQAMNQDAHPVSLYATEGLFEDFAETFALYVRARGTPLHGVFRDYFPARFALLDTVYQEVLAGKWRP